MIEVAIGAVFAAEYPNDDRRDYLILSRGGALEVGKRLRYRDHPDLHLEYGKQYPYATVGSTGPWGLDAMVEFTHEAGGATSVLFRDGVQARARVGDISALQCSCEDQGPQGAQCRHAVSALILAAGAEDVTIPDANDVFPDRETSIRTQLAGAIDDYLDNRADPSRLLRAADAGYAYLRGSRALRFAPLIIATEVALDPAQPLVDVLFA